MRKRDGLRLDLKKVYELYKEERLTARKRGGRMRALSTRAPTTIPKGFDQRWSIDFVQDAPMADASASSTWSTTSRENAWRVCSTHRYWVCGSSENSSDYVCCEPDRR